MKSGHWGPEPEFAMVSNVLQWDVETVPEFFDAFQLFLNLTFDIVFVYFVTFGRVIYHYV